MKINVISGRPDCGMYKGRCQGKSTGLALRTISEAILNPGKEVPIVDHHGTTQADRHLLGLVEVIIGNLNLKGMTLKRHSLSVRFDLFQDSDNYVEINGEIYKRLEL